MSAYFGQLPINGMMYNGRECSAMYNGNVIWPTATVSRSSRWSASGIVSGSGWGFSNVLAASSLDGWSAEDTSMLSLLHTPSVLGLSGSSYSPLSASTLSFNAVDRYAEELQGFTLNSAITHTDLNIMFSAHFVGDGSTTNTFGVWMYPTALVTTDAFLPHTSTYSANGVYTTSDIDTAYTFNRAANITLTLNTYSGKFRGNPWQHSSTATFASAVEYGPTFYNYYKNAYWLTWVTSMWSASGIMHV